MLLSGQEIRLLNLDAAGGALPSCARAFPGMNAPAPATARSVGFRMNPVAFWWVASLQWQPLFSRFAVGLSCLLLNFWQMTLWSLRDERVSFCRGLKVLFATWTFVLLKKKRSFRL